MTEQEKINQLQELVRDIVESVPDASDVACQYCEHEGTPDFELHCRKCTFRLREVE